MDHRSKFLLGCAQKLGYIEATNTISENSTDDFLHHKLNPQQLHRLYFLYLKNCLLNGAQKQGYVNELQKKQFLQHAYTQKTITLSSVTQKIVPLPFYQKLVMQLFHGKIIGSTEYQIFQQIYQSFHSTNPVQTPVDERSIPLGGNSHSITSQDENSSGQITLDGNQIISQNANSNKATFDGNFSNTQSHATVFDSQDNQHSTYAMANNPAVQTSSIFAERYHIDSELGKGGMGVVYKAYDNKLGRHVALKLILSQQAKEVQIQRFLKEAQVVAQLDHPNTIRIFDIGEHPQKYFTMEYIEGKTLSDHIGKSLNFKTTAKIIHKVALALHNAHRQNLIHRDIKPSNIMLDKKKEPRLMDFGLVKDNDSQLSQEGDMLGTPAYMSPEQAHGTEALVQSDIYSLGATLYEALTGRVPFDGSSTLNIIVQIMQKEPVRPRDLNPDIPSELEAIALKCMEKKPSNRYKSAHLLARDLENYLKNRPIMASSPTRFTYFKKLVARNKAISAVSALLIIVVFGTIALFVHFQIQAIRTEQQRQNEKLAAKEQIRMEREKAEEAEEEKQRQIRAERERAKEAEKEILKKQLYKANIALASMRLKNFNVSGALSALKFDENANKELEWYWLHNNLSTPHKSFGEAIYKNCAFYPKGNMFVASTQNSLELWSIQTQQKIWTFHSLRTITQCDFSPNGEWIVVATEHSRKTKNRTGAKPVQNIYLIDANSGKKVYTYEGHAFPVSSCFFSHDGNRIISGGEDSMIKIWDVKKNKNPLQQIDLLRSFKELAIPTNSLKNFYVSSCSLSRDNNYLVASQEDNLMLWKNINGQYKLVDQKSYSMDEKRNIGSVTCCVFHPVFHNTFISTSENSYIDIWQIQQDKFVFQRSLERVHNGKIEHCTFSKDGKKMISVGQDTAVIQWNVVTAKKIFLDKVFYGHKLRVQCCDISANGKHIISAADSIKLWNTNSSSRPLKIAKSSISKQEIRGDFSKTIPEFFATVGEGLKIWDWKQKKLHKILSKNRLFYTCAFHPKKNKIATGDKKPYAQNMLKQKFEVLEWDLENGKAKVINHHNRSVRFCAYSHDGRYLVSVGEEIKIFDHLTKKEFVMPKEHRRGIRWCGFNPHNHNQFVTASETLVLWDIEKKQAVSRFLDNQREERIGKIIFAAFHPKKPLLLTADAYFGGKNGLTLWQIQNNKIEYLVSVPGHKLNLTSCAFNRKGNRIISSSRDKTIKIWDFDMNAKRAPKSWIIELLTLQKHEDEIRFCGISSHDEVLISCGDSGVIYIWDMQQGDKD